MERETLSLDMPEPVPDGKRSSRRSGQEHLCVLLSIQMGQCAVY
jgi:hypothetical protein